MPVLTNKPVKPKYTVGDTVFAFDSGSILQLTIVQVQIIVTNPNNDSNGLQTNYYTFSENSLKLSEAQLASSKNHLLGKAKGAYLNDVPFESVTGLQFDNPGQADLACFNLAGLDLSAVVINANTIADGMSLDGNAGLPTAVDTKSEFRAVVKSYDENTTIWVDGNPIGRS